MCKYFGCLYKYFNIKYTIIQVADKNFSIFIINYIGGQYGKELQIAEGWTVALPHDVSDTLWARTDYT